MSVSIRWIVAAAVIVGPPSAWADVASGSLFQPSNNCIACHSGLTTPKGEDVSIGHSWRATMMANAARDPYWQAAVRREVMDHPESQAAIEAECSRCHMPMSTVEAVAAGGQGEVFRHLPVGATDDPADQLAADGVSCTVCHQIQEDNFGSEESFTGHFLVDTTRQEERELFGPNGVDEGRATIMHSASGFRPTESGHIKESELCATCHTLFTHTLDSEGQVIGRLPEQTPYLEWLASDYADTKYCQDCHMPVAEEGTPIASVWGQPRDEMSRHEFRGGNFFMMRMLNRYRAELGVVALPQELELAAIRTIQHLQSDAATVTIDRLEVDGGRLRADVVVDNLAGHKLPTAYPSRRVWLHVIVRDEAGDTIFESGAFRPDGSIEGNDNDADPSRYEPHHLEIGRSGDVQIYESILVDQGGRVTTGLLSGLRYAKDNRILPTGFDKAAVSDDIAVHGAAATDDGFRGGQDRTRYVIEVADAEGPFTVEAELWYQPIGYRWAENLRGYDSFETNRFTAYWDSMAAGSAVILARETATSD